MKLKLSVKESVRAATVVAILVEAEAPEAKKATVASEAHLATVLSTPTTSADQMACCMRMNAWRPALEPA